MTTPEITPGMFIVRSDGGVDRVRSLTHRKDPRGLILSDRSEWRADSCRPATLHDFTPAGPCSKQYGAETGRRGFTIACSCTQLWGGSHWVKTPCCQEGRRGVESNDTVICPSCGWYWWVFIAPGGTRWVSSGFGKPTARHYMRGATGRAIGVTEYGVLESLATHDGGSGSWWPGCGWCWGNTSKTVRALEGLARMGLAEDLRQVDGHEYFRITKAGRAELPRSLRNR